MDDIGVQVVNVVGSFMLAAALQAAGVPAPFLTLVIGSYQVVPSITYTTQQLGDVAVLSILNSTYTTTATPTIPLAAVNTTNFTALAQKLPASSINLDFFIIERFFDKSALETAILRKQQSRLSKLVAQEARAAWSVVEDSTSTVPSTPAALQALPIGAAELILLVISVIVIASAVVYVRLSRRESGRANADEPQNGLATRHSNAEVEIDCGAPPAVPTSTVDDERVLDDVASSHVERDGGLETSPQPDQPPQIASAVEDLRSVTERTPQPIPEVASFDDDTNPSNQPDSSSPSRTASPTPVDNESTGDNYDEVTLEDTFISSPTPQDLPSPLDAVNGSVTSDERVLSDDVQTAEDVDDNLSKASSNQSLSDKDCDEVLVSGPREVDQDADMEEFIAEDSSFAKADVDCADDDESEAEDMPDDALIFWTKSLKGHMSPDWYETQDEDEDSDNSESDASDEDDTPVATVEELEVDEPTFEELEIMAPSPIQPFPFAETDELPCFEIEDSNPLVIEDIFESFSATPKVVEEAASSPIQSSSPVPTDDGPQSDNEEPHSSDVGDLSESSAATSEDPEVTTPSPTIPSPRMDDDVQLHPDVETVNAKLAETLENLKAKSSTSSPAAVVPIASPVTPGSHSLMHLLPSATHSEPDVLSEAEPSPALQRVLDILKTSARADGVQEANELEDKIIYETPGTVDLEAATVLAKVDEALVASTKDMGQVYAEENKLACQDALPDSAPPTEQEGRATSPVLVDETRSDPEPEACPEIAVSVSEPVAASTSSSPRPIQSQDERSTEDVIAAELARHATNLDPENQRRIHGVPLAEEVQVPAVVEPADAISTHSNPTAALSNLTVSPASSTSAPISLPATTIYLTAPSIPPTTPAQPIPVCNLSPHHPRFNHPPRLSQQAPMAPPGLSRNIAPCGPVVSRVCPAFCSPQGRPAPQVPFAQQGPAFNQRPVAFNNAPQALNSMPRGPQQMPRAMNPTAPSFAPGPPRVMQDFVPRQVPPPQHLPGPQPFNGMPRPPPQMSHEMPPPPGLPMPCPPPPHVLPPQQQVFGPPQQCFPHPGQHVSPMNPMPRHLGMHGPGPQQLSAGPPRFANLAPQGQAFQCPSPTFQGPPPPMPFPPGLGPMHQGPNPMHQGPSPMHQARPPMLLGLDGHPPMPAFDGPPPVIFDGPSPAVSILPGFSPIVSPFRPSLQGEEYVRPAGLFAAPRAPGLVEAPEVPPGLPAPVAPIAAVPALVEDMLAPVENASAPVENAPAPVDDTTAPLHDTLFLSEDARFRSLEADRVSGAASVAPRPAHPRVQSPDAPERPASAPPVTPETVDTTPEMISGVLKWREGGEVRRAVLQSPEDWVTSPKSVEGTLANGEQVRDAGLQVEVENVQQVEHDAPASEETTSAQVSTPSSENNPQEPTHPAPQRHKPRRPKTTIFVLGGGLPARATHR